MGAFFVVVVVVVSVRCVCVFLLLFPNRIPNKREREWEQRVEEKEIWIFDFISPARRFLGGFANEIQ